MVVDFLSRLGARLLSVVHILAKKATAGAKRQRISIFLREQRTEKKNVYGNYSSGANFASWWCYAPLPCFQRYSFFFFFFFFFWGTKQGYPNSFFGFSFFSSIISQGWLFFFFPQIFSCLDENLKKKKKGGSENEVEKKAHLEEDSKGLGVLVRNILFKFCGKKVCENAIGV